MAATLKSERHLEIAHVLFIDAVGYSKLLVNEQRELIQELNQVVRKTPQFRKSDRAGKLIRIPMGDGMALVFFQTPEEPVQCAMEITRALQTHPRLHLRMGVHSGPVDQMKDLNERLNVAGTGINTAKRVMDCGDAGHILLSKRVADDLAQDSLWHCHLHELGEIEVKHGTKLGVVNLYTKELGNPDVPEKFRQFGRQPKTLAFGSKTGRARWPLIAAAVIIVAALAVGVLAWSHRGAPVLTNGATSPGPAAANVSAAAEKSVAVLPFENLSEEKANEFFADGVQDEILTDLARIADLKVISRASVMQYKTGIARNLREIGQQLAVAHVVEGTVQRSGNRVRVNAQLIDARTDKQLWGQTYDRDLADVFAIQSEIAKTIADQLQAKLSPREEKAIERAPTTDMAAFDLYTRAKNILLKASQTKEDFLQAVDLLNQAIARDPSFFDAYCQLAQAHDALYWFGHDQTPARLALAEAAIQSATRLRPDAGETHLARAENLYRGYRDYDGTLAELEIARQTLPNDFRISQLIAFIQRRQGHWEESTRSLEHAAELNPRDMITRVAIATNYTFLRRYADVKSALASTLAVFPNAFDMRTWLAYVEFQAKADTQPLHQFLDSVRATNPAVIPSIANKWLACALAERDAAAAKNALDVYNETEIGFGGGEEVPLSRSSFEGLIARMRKDEGTARSAFVTARAEQQKVLQAQPNDSATLCELGLIDAFLGRKEDALREGRRAVELLPLKKDAMDGVVWVANLAIIAAWVGDNDLAFEQLDSIIHLPSPLSYGGLKLLPWWDPLRGDPRFEKLLEEAKQPVGLK